MKLQKLRVPVTVSDEKLARRCVNGRVVVIDDDPEILSALAALFELEGYACETYSSAVTYLQVLAYNRPCFPGPCCVLCDVAMPELNGLKLQNRLSEHDNTPLILMSGSSDVQDAIHGFRAGAVDFLLKPIDADLLLMVVAKALSLNAEQRQQQAVLVSITDRIAALTLRERQVATLVVSGQINRVIAQQLGISLRTVKLYRQRVMEKLGADSLAELVRIADFGNLLSDKR